MKIVRRFLALGWVLMLPPRAARPRPEPPCADRRRAWPAAAECVEPAPGMPRRTPSTDAFRRAPGLRAIRPGHGAARSEWEGRPSLR